MNRATYGLPPPGLRQELAETWKKTPWAVKAGYRSADHRTGCASSRTASRDCFDAAAHSALVDAAVHAVRKTLCVDPAVARDIDLPPRAARVRSLVHTLLARPCRWRWAILIAASRPEREVRDRAEDLLLRGDVVERPREQRRLHESPRAAHLAAPPGIWRLGALRPFLPEIAQRTRLLLGAHDRLMLTSASI